MTVQLVGSTGANSGTGTATASALTVALPAGSAAGNVATLFLESLNTTVTLTVPTGWTLATGTSEVNGGNGQSWFLYKELTSADITAGSVTVNFSTAQRCVAAMDVWSGVTATGLQIATNIDTASNTNEPTMAISNVPAGGLFLVGFAYRASGAMPDVSLTAGYTQGGRFTSDSSASPYLSIETQYQTPSTAGSYGGETASSGSVATGVSYSVALAPAGGGAPATLNKTKVGVATLAKAYVGSQPVSKMYVGSTQIFP